MTNVTYAEAHEATRLSSQPFQSTVQELDCETNWRRRSFSLTDTSTASCRSSRTSDLINTIWPGTLETPTIGRFSIQTC